ncbi:MAG TPA: hypothetical protein VFB14_08210 [Bryobacteraceae bacterium]|jgi:hypothetical protein|nr:hypothetical protein [Bryobacteraceae bacterium]
MSSIGQDSTQYRLDESRRRLLTPLDHIVEYSEMLLGGFEPGDVSEIPARLRNICAAAQELRRLVSTAWGESYAPEMNLHSVRTGMLPFLYEISQNVGELLRETAPHMTLGLLRIGSGTTDLMAFAQEDTLAKQVRAPARTESSKSFA